MEQSPELAALVEEWFAAASRGDASVVDQYVLVEPEVRLVGSDPQDAFLNQDGWKLVQTHPSITVPNDEVGWSYD